MLTLLLFILCTVFEKGLIFGSKPNNIKITSIARFLQTAKEFSELIFCTSDNFIYDDDSKYIRDCASDFLCALCDCKLFANKQENNSHTIKEIALKFFIMRVSNATEFERHISLGNKILSKTNYKSMHQFIYILPSLAKMNLEQLMEKSNHVQFDSSTKIFFDANESETTNDKLKEYYMIGYLNIWNTVDDISQSMLLRRSDFRGSQVKVVVQFDPDFRSELDVEYVGNDTIRMIGGSAFQVLNDLKDLLNFTIATIAGKGWITQNPDGTLTGIANQIITGEADLSVAQSTMAFYRATFLSFMQPVAYYRYYAVFRQPLAQKNIDILFSAFCGDVWIAIGILWLLIMSFLLAVNRLKKYLNVLSIEETVDKQDLFIATLGILCQQGWQNSGRAKVNTFSEKLLVVVFMLVIVFLYALYSSKIISSLSVVHQPIKNFDGLLKYNYIILSRPSLPLLTSVVEDEKQAAMLIAQTKHHYVDEETSVRSIVDTKQVFGTGDPIPYAFATSLPSFFSAGRVLNYSDVELCKVATVPVGNVRFKDAMFVKKRSVYQEFFNYGTIKVIERGLNSRYFKAAFTDTNAHCDTTKNGSRQLTFQDFQSAYFIFCTGLCLASFAVLADFLLKPIHIYISRYFK